MIYKNIKRYIAGGAATVMVAAAIAAPAMATGGPTTGPEAGPGCFGNWRAGSVQWLNQNGFGPVGLNYFSQRAGDNSTINAENRAECASL